MVSRHAVTPRQSVQRATSRATETAADVAPAGTATVKGKVGTMAEYMAELVDRGVAHAGAAYRLFYR